MSLAVTKNRESKFRAWGTVEPPALWRQNPRHRQNAKNRNRPIALKKILCFWPGFFRCVLSLYSGQESHVSRCDIKTPSMTLKCNAKCHPCKKLECQRTSALARSHFIQGALTDNTRYPHTCQVWLQEQFLLVKNTCIVVHQARCFQGASKPRCNRFEWCFQRIAICHLARSCLD